MRLCDHQFGYNIIIFYYCAKIKTEVYNTQVLVILQGKQLQGDGGWVEREFHNLTVEGKGVLSYMSQR